MIIPFSTDAPIYHWPRATLGLILANIGIYFWSVNVDPELVRPLLLRLGGGLHPIQWLSHNFLHADILHIGFNMVFLWAYGIIVEGKVGPFAFLACYLALATAQGFGIQMAYAHAETPNYVLGASGAIFGLMAMCMIWAPVNDLSCFFLFIVGFRIITHVLELPIYGFALLQLFLEGLGVVFQFLVNNDPMSSAFLHLSGAFWGLILGVALLKLRLVDCEDWDVFSLMTRRRELNKAWKAREDRLDRAQEHQRLIPNERKTRREEVKKSPEERSAALLARCREALDVGDMDNAHAHYQKWRELHAQIPPREALVDLVKRYHEHQEWAASVPLMRDYCRAYPEHAASMRLNLATALIKFRDRPNEALRVLEGIPAGTLTGAMESRRRQLVDRAQRMLEDGVLELEEDT
jgi:membrane associated rhomboid family serine protease